MEEKKYLRRDELAKFCGVKPRTVDTWLQRGKISKPEKIAGVNYFELGAVARDLNLNLSVLEAIQKQKEGDQ